MSCTHTSATVTTELRRIIADDNDDVLGFQILLSIKCNLCAEVFHFPALPPGIGHTEAQVSNDGTELRIPIKPGKSIPIKTPINTLIGLN